MSTPRYVDDPLKVDARAMTAETDQYGWIADLIRAVLFTMPGERVHRSDFGSGLPQLLFVPESSELAATVRLLLQGSLQQWVGHLIAIEDVQVDVDDTQITVTVVYTVRSTGDRRTDQFTTAGAA